MNKDILTQCVDLLIDASDIVKENPCGASFQIGWVVANLENLLKEMEHSRNQLHGN